MTTESVRTEIDNVHVKNSRGVVVAIVRVSKEIEMRYLSFLNFYLEKEKLWLLINSILRACSQQGDLIVK